MVSDANAYERKKDLVGYKLQIVGDAFFLA
jgi:hypothetical protein